MSQQIEAEEDCQKLDSGLTFDEHSTAAIADTSSQICIVIASGIIIGESISVHSVTTQNKSQD
jgi:hypothetical protein